MLHISFSKLLLLTVSRSSMYLIVSLYDARSRFLFKFRSCTHSLNELGRHRGKEGKTECSLCGS